MSNASDFLPIVGTQWIQGAGAPNVGTGSNGQFYEDTTNGNVYYKAGGTWTLTLIHGGGGTTWLRGAGAPSNVLGADGNYYEDTSTGNVYFKTAGTWNVTLIHGGGGGGGSVVTTSVTKTIGSGGDFPTLSAFLTGYYQTQAYAPGVVITAQYLSTYTLTLADQITFTGDFSNLLIESQGPTDNPVDTTGFVNSVFGIPFLFVLVNCSMGGILGAFHCITPTLPAPTPSGAMLVVNSTFSMFDANLATPKKAKFTGFGNPNADILFIKGSTASYQGTFDSITTEFSDVSLLATTIGGSSKQGPALAVQGGGEIYSVSAVVTNNGGANFGIPVIAAVAGGIVEITASTINVNTRLASLAQGSKIGLYSTTLNIDQTSLFTNNVALIGGVASSELVIDMSAAMTFATTNSGAKFIELGGINILSNSVVRFLTGGSAPVLTSQWALISDVPIGQEFANGSGVFGLSVDVPGNYLGETTVSATEGGSITRASHSSVVTVQPAGNLTNFTIVNGDAPVGARIKYVIAALGSIANLNIQGIGSWNIPNTGAIITLFRNTNGWQIESAPPVSLLPSMIVGKQFTIFNSPTTAGVGQVLIGTVVIPYTLLTLPVASVIADFDVQASPLVNSIPPPSAGPIRSTHRLRILFDYSTTSFTANNVSAKIGEVHPVGFVTYPNTDVALTFIGAVDINFTTYTLSIYGQQTNYDPGTGANGQHYYVEATYRIINRGGTLNN